MQDGSVKMGDFGICKKKAPKFLIPLSENSEAHV